MSGKVLARALALLLVACSVAPAESPRPGPAVAAALPAALPPGCRVPAARPSGPRFAVVAGDLDQHADLASRFLSGCSQECANRGNPRCVIRPGLHVPASSPASWLHQDCDVPLYSRYYEDRDRAGSGLDHDPDHGIDRAEVIVYAGHGSPTSLSSYGFRDRSCATPVAPPDAAVPLRSLQLGDDGGRYLLLFSCLTMAHGPQRCATGGSPLDFGCPADFSPGTGEDVFGRWASALAPQLRMACGGVTELLTAPHGAARFWHGYLAHRLPVADAFLLAASHGHYTALCLSRGPADPRRTPLVTDGRFTDQPNRLPPTPPFLHAIYPLRGTPSATAAAAELARIVAREPRPAEALQKPPPETWAPPLIEVGRTLAPSAAFAVDGDGDETLGFRVVPPPRFPESHIGPVPEGLRVRLHPRSGAAEITLRSTPPGEAAEDGAGLRRLVDQVRERFRIGPGQLTAGVGARAAPPEIEAFTLRIDGVPETGGAPLRCFETCSYARLRGWIEIEGQELPLLDEGGEWLLRSCPAGPAVVGGPPPRCPAAGSGEHSLSYVGRRVLGATEPAQPPPLLGSAAETKGWEELRRLRMGGIGDPTQRFRLDRRDLGYVGAPVHCTQTWMMPVHRFVFVDRRSGHPVEIRVPVYEPSELAEDVGLDCAPGP